MEWRQALEVGLATDGTRAVFRENPRGEVGQKARAAAYSIVCGAEQRAGLIAASTGRRLSKASIGKSRRSLSGRKRKLESVERQFESRRRMQSRSAHDGRPWTDDEDALLLSLPVKRYRRADGSYCHGSIQASTKAWARDTTHEENEEEARLILFCQLVSARVLFRLRLQYCPFELQLTGRRLSVVRLISVSVFCRTERVSVGERVGFGLSSIHSAVGTCGGHAANVPFSHVLVLWDQHDQECQELPPHFESAMV